jgi:hypothetical protein
MYGEGQDGNYGQGENIMNMKHVPQDLTMGKKKESPQLLLWLTWRKE